MTTISRTSSWTAATSGSSPSNTPKYSSKARGRRRAAGGGARRPKKSPKLGRDAAFSAIFFFERRVLSDLSLCKGDVRPRVSAIATAKTATKKRKKCHKSHSQNRTHFQILLQRLVNYRYRLRDVV